MINIKRNLSIISSCKETNFIFIIELNITKSIGLIINNIKLNLNDLLFSFTIQDWPLNDINDFNLKINKENSIKKWFWLFKKFTKSVFGLIKFTNHIIIWFKII